MAEHDIFDDLLAAPDFDERPKAARKMGLIVGPKRSTAELDARYGGKYYFSSRCGAAVEFEQEEIEDQS